jgi:hypothetical protein
MAFPISKRIKKIKSYFMEKMLAADPSSNTLLAFSLQSNDDNGTVPLANENESEDFWNKLVSKNQNEVESKEKEEIPETRAEEELDKLANLNITNEDPPIEEGENDEDLIKDYLLQEYQKEIEQYQMIL